MFCSTVQPNGTLPRPAAPRLHELALGALATVPAFLGAFYHAAKVYTNLAYSTMHVDAAVQAKSSLFVSCVIVSARAGGVARSEL